MRSLPLGGVELAMCTWGWGVARAQRRQGWQDWGGEKELPRGWERVGLGEKGEGLALLVCSTQTRRRPRVCRGGDPRLLPQ